MEEVARQTRRVWRPARRPITVGVREPFPLLRKMILFTFTGASIFGCVEIIQVPTTPTPIPEIVPAPTTPSSPTVGPTNPTNSALWDESFWEELFFAKLGWKSNSAATRNSSTKIWSDIPNIYVTTHHDGELAIRQEWLSAMIRSLPNYMHQITGQPYHQRIQQGRTPDYRRGQITFVFIEVFV